MAESEGSGEREQKKGSPPLQVWAWTAEEDEILVEHVRQHGTRKWKELVDSGRLHQRSTKACCNRFRRLRELHEGSALPLDPLLLSALRDQPPIGTPMTHPLSDLHGVNSLLAVGRSQPQGFLPQATPPWLEMDAALPAARLAGEEVLSMSRGGVLGVAADPVAPGLEFQAQWRFVASQQQLLQLDRMARQGHTLCEQLLSLDAKGFGLQRAPSPGSCGQANAAVPASSRHGADCEQAGGGYAPGHDAHILCTGVQPLASQAVSQAGTRAGNGVWGDSCSSQLPLKGARQVSRSATTSTLDAEALHSSLSELLMDAAAQQGLAEVPTLCMLGSMQRQKSLAAVFQELAREASRLDAPKGSGPLASHRASTLPSAAAPLGTRSLSAASQGRREGDRLAAHLDWDGALLANEQCQLALLKGAPGPTADILDKGAGVAEHPAGTTWQPALARTAYASPRSSLQEEASFAMQAEAPQRPAALQVDPSTQSLGDLSAVVSMPSKPARGTWGRRAQSLGGTVPLSAQQSPSEHASSSKQLFTYLSAPLQGAYPSPGTPQRRYLNAKGGALLSLVHGHPQEYGYEHDYSKRRSHTHGQGLPEASVSEPQLGQQALLAEPSMQKTRQPPPRGGEWNSTPFAEASGGVDGGEQKPASPLDPSIFGSLNGQGFMEGSSAASLLASQGKRKHRQFRADQDTSAPADLGNPLDTLTPESDGLHSSHLARRVLYNHLSKLRCISDGDMMMANASKIARTGDPAHKSTSRVEGIPLEGSQAGSNFRELVKLQGNLSKLN